MGVGLTGLGWLTGLIATFAGLLTPLFRPLLAFKPLLAGLLGSKGTLEGCWAGVGGAMPAGAAGKGTPGGSVCVPKEVCGLAPDSCVLKEPGVVWKAGFC